MEVVGLAGDVLPAGEGRAARVAGRGVVVAPGAVLGPCQQAGEHLPQAVEVVLVLGSVPAGETVAVPHGAQGGGMEVVGLAGDVLPAGEGRAGRRVVVAPRAVLRPRDEAGLHDTCTVEVVAVQISVRANEISSVFNSAVGFWVEVVRLPINSTPLRQRSIRRRIKVVVLTIDRLESAYSFAILISVIHLAIDGLPSSSRLLDFLWLLFTIKLSLQRGSCELACF